MSWLQDVVNTLSSVPIPVTLAGAAAFALGESGLGIGIFVPGETVVLLLGAALAESPALIPLFIVVALASCAGDHIGYLLGRHYGERLGETRLVARIGPTHWARAGAALNRWGAWAVFLTRLVPVVRTLTPALAGIAEVAYLRFLPASLAGASLWSATYTFAGALAGTSISRLEPILGQAGWLAGLVLAAGLVVWLRFRRPKDEVVATSPQQDEVSRCLSSQQEVNVADPSQPDIRPSKP